MDMLNKLALRDANRINLAYKDVWDHVFQYMEVVFAVEFDGLDCGAVAGKAAMAVQEELVKLLACEREGS